MSDNNATGLSILGFFIFYILLDLTFSTLGFTLMMHHPAVEKFIAPGYSADSESSITSIGFFILAFSIMLSWRLYHILKKKKLKKHITSSQNRKWLIILGGLSVYTLCELALQSFGRDFQHVLYNIINLIIFAAVGWVTLTNFFNVPNEKEKTQ